MSRFKKGDYVFHRLLSQRGFVEDAEDGFMVRVRADSGRSVWWHPTAIEVVGGDDSDPVNSPNHYLAGGVETIDIIKAWLTNDEYRGYLKGAAIEYLARHHRKCEWSRLVADLEEAQDAG